MSRPNIIQDANTSLWEKTLSSSRSLWSYTQSNCQVTLTDEGYRIYRPPNKNPTDDGNTMWGGLIIRPHVGDDWQVSSLQKNHTYILKFELKGKTSNAVSDMYWSNEAGWGGGGYGLSTNPSAVSHSSIGTNWVSDKWVNYYYRFTITDDIMKQCTKSYSSYVQGNYYNTYKDFKFGFTYSDTGDMGTDLYLRNFRLYDITNHSSVESKIDKQGVFLTDNWIEIEDVSSIFLDGDIEMRDFTEL